MKFVPKVLILVAAFNGEPWLRQQLDSILSQEDVDVHILICDDHSTDKTPEIINEYLNVNSRVACISTDISSGSAGANFRRLYVAADLVDIDYVALSDQDDIWFPNKLISAINCLDDFKSDGYSCAVQATWSNGRKISIQQSGAIRSSDFIFEGAGQGCTFVTTNRLFTKVQDFVVKYQAASDSLHYHDWLVYVLSRAWNMPWYFDSTPWIIYRQHENNEIGARGSFSSIVNRLKKIRDGWYIKQVKAALFVYQTAGGSNAVTFYIGKLIHSPHSRRRSMLLLVAVLKHGRRSLTDRLVLAISAFLGWL